MKPVDFSKLVVEWEIKTGNFRISEIDFHIRLRIGDTLSPLPYRGSEVTPVFSKDWKLLALLNALELPVMHFSDNTYGFAVVLKAVKEPEFLIERMFERIVFSYTHKTEGQLERLFAECIPAEVSDCAVS